MNIYIISVDIINGQQVMKLLSWPSLAGERHFNLSKTFDLVDIFLFFNRQKQKVGILEKF